MLYCKNSTAIFLLIYLREIYRNVLYVRVAEIKYPKIIVILKFKI